MHAIRVHIFGDPDVLAYEETPTPQAQGEQVLVKVAAAGVNPVDTYIRAGAYAGLPELPYVPGKDGAGTLPDGRRVYLSGSLTGTYADYCLCSPDQVHPLPAGVSFEQGATLGVPYATAYQALFHRGQAQPGQRLLVRGGSGAVGLAAIQLAVARGLRVTATASSEAGRALLLAQGAETAVEHAQTDGPYELILEMLANRNLDRDLDELASGGTVVVVGNRGRVEIDPRKTMGKELTIRGMALFNATPEEHRRIHAGLQAGLASGVLKPIVREALPLVEAAQAHRQVLEPGACGNLVLIP
ncbi:MAG: NADPH:quinone reductase [Vulcanimicrobiota bacterium]